MRFFSRKRSGEPERSTHGTPIGTRRLAIVWNDDDAQLVYQLQRWETCGYLIREPLCLWKPLSHGDLRWAKRIAEHYGLAMPELEEAA